MDRALPAGNRRVPTGIISGGRTVKYYQIGTICRDLIIKSELVTTDGIETDRFYKFGGAVNCRCAMADCYRPGNKVSRFNSLMRHGARVATGYTFSPGTNRPALFVNPKPIWLIPTETDVPPKTSRQIDQSSSPTLKLRTLEIGT